MSHIRKILAPVDGSQASIAGLSEAVRMAQDLDATVDVLHVEAPDAFSIGSTTATTEDASKHAVADMETAIGRAKAVLAERVSSRSAVGEPLRTILDMAAAESVDLIVMGTHGRVGRLHSWVGSVAEELVRNAPCPVLTVRRSNGEDESFAERIHPRGRIAEPPAQPK
jgi:nucleotide-binding universal stress UspA family protein